MENNSSFGRTQIIGLVLIGLIFAYFAYNNSGQTPAEPAPQQEEVRSEPTEQTSEPSAEEVVPESAASEDSTIESREAKTYTIENDVLSLTFSDQGGQIVSARLKEYQTYDSLPLFLINENQVMDFQVGEWNSSDAWFNVSERTATSLALTAETPEGKMTLRWALKAADEFQLDFTVSGEVANPKELVLDWRMAALRHEKAREQEKQKTTISYWDIEDGDMESLSATGDDEERGQNIRWIANKQQFFSGILTATGRFDSAAMTVVELDNEEFVKEMRSHVSVQTVNGNYSVPMQLYLGPNKYDILKEYGLEYDQIIDFGWGIFGWISRGVVVKVFNWLDGYGLNYGLIILIMALMIKLVLMPLTFTSYRSMAKMRVLKPEIDEINEEFKDQDPMKKQQAMMDLYRKAGVNPLGGCIPQLLQLPILIAMFRFFPASIELRQESFLWATDLSSFDSIAKLPFEIPFYGDHISLFTILMAISTFMYSYMNQQLTGSSSQMPQMKIIIYLMPVMLLFFFNSYPAGLSYYYLVANLITFGQQFAIRAFIDDDAIHAKLQANKEKPKKQSKLQQRLSKAMDQQQEMQQGNRRMRRMNK